MNPAKQRGMRDRREGMILLNVLIIVAIAATAVAVMIASEDIQVQRTIRLHDASQAQAYARAGELSAVVALRRDGLVSPDFDAYSEPWAGINQQSIAIPGGRFALTITDEQALFNLNGLMRDDAIVASRYRRIADAAKLSPTSVTAIAAIIRSAGPLRDDGLLRSAGISAAELARLAGMTTYLPVETGLNLNTAGPDLLTALIDDPKRLRDFMDIRSRNGRITEAELAQLGLTGLGGLGSSHYQLTTRVTVGDVTQTRRSRILRTGDRQGIEVAVVARRRTAD